MVTSRDVVRKLSKKRLSSRKMADVSLPVFATNIFVQNPESGEYFLHSHISALQPVNEANLMLRLRETYMDPSRSRKAKVSRPKFDLFQTFRRDISQGGYISDEDDEMDGDSDEDDETEYTANGEYDSNSEDDDSNSEG